MIVGILLIGLVPASARGDGGTVRLSEEVEAYRVTVFTTPTPLQAGPVDLSVLVQDRATGQPVLDVPVTITLAPAAAPDEELRDRATHQAATNKLLQAAVFSLDTPGRWLGTVEVGPEDRPARVRFELEVGDPPPRWRDLWLWIAWPVVPIGLYSLREIRRNLTPSRKGAKKKTKN